MHYGFVAVPGTIEQFVSAFGATWPMYETTVRATLPSMDEYLLWKQGNERPISAEGWTPEIPITHVYGFVQDGPWAVLLDLSYELASDSEALAKLSESFGSCYSFIVETAAGYASFMSFEQGRLRRSIDSTDGEVTAVGDAIPEEAGLQVDSYYMVETEELQRRLGFRFLDDATPTEVAAFAAIDRNDRTDYSALYKRQEVAPRKKPWWRLW